MKTEERIAKQRLLIEELGRYFDKEGHQPIAGRILGLMMVMDKEMFTFEEITEELQISKSSASNTLRNLEIRGNIEYITLPGDRKRYFRIRVPDSFSLLDEFARKMVLFKEMSTRIYELKGDKNSRNAVFLTEMISTIDFFLNNIAVLKEQYAKRK